MQVTPVSPVATAANDKRPPTAHGATLATRKASAQATQTSASARPELYGNAGKFGAFPCYGNFSAKV